MSANRRIAAFLTLADEELNADIADVGWFIAEVRAFLATESTGSP